VENYIEKWMREERGEKRSVGLEKGNSRRSWVGEEK